MLGPRALRFALLEAEVPIYRLAPAAGVHPARLGAMLAGKLPLPPEVAQRVEAALARELAAAERREVGAAVEV
jgi:hypothetical protein